VEKESTSGGGVCRSIRYQSKSNGLGSGPNTLTNVSETRNSLRREIYEQKREKEMKRRIIEWGSKGDNTLGRVKK